MKTQQDTSLLTQNVSIVEEQEKFPFFFIPNYTEHLSDCWEKVLHLGEKHVYQKNEDFCLTHGFAYVQSGLVISYFREFLDLRDEIRSFIGAGCLIKDTYSGAEYGHWPTLHKCVEDTVIYIFNADIVYNHEFIKNYPDLLKNYIYSISAKSLSNWFLCSISKQTSNSQKLAYYLYGFYLLRGRKNSFEAPLTQRQLAALLGIDIMTVNRIVSNFKKKGILSCWTKNRMEILDIETLKNLRLCDSKKP